MSTRTRLAAFVAVLLAVFGLGWGAGAAVRPLDDTPAPAAGEPSTEAPAAGQPHPDAPTDPAPTTSTAPDHDHGGSHP